MLVTPRLNSYLAKIQAVDSDQCRCNCGSETVDHFLFCCSRWRNLRQELRSLVGDRMGRFSLCIWGGWMKRKMGHLTDGHPLLPWLLLQLSLLLQPAASKIGADEGEKEEDSSTDEEDAILSYKFKELNAYSAYTTKLLALSRLRRCIDCQHFQKEGSRSYEEEFGRIRDRRHLGCVDGL